MENLKECLIKLGIYDSGKIERFKFFMNILKEWNSFMNLTAIKDDEGIEIKHIIDSCRLRPCGQCKRYFGAYYSVCAKKRKMLRYR